MYSFKYIFLHNPYQNNDLSIFQLHYELPGFLRDVQRCGCGIPPPHRQLNAVRLAPPDGGAVPRLLRCQPGCAHPVCGGETGRWVGRRTITQLQRYVSTAVIFFFVVLSVLSWAVEKKYVVMYSTPFIICVVILCSIKLIK